MILEWPQEKYMPRSFSMHKPCDKSKTLKQNGRCIDLSERVASGQIEAQELSSGFLLIQSNMRFQNETIFREEYKERNFFQLSFCLEGNYSWTYNEKTGPYYQLSPTECSLHYGALSQCNSCYEPNQNHRSLSISIEQERFPHFKAYLEATHLPLSKQNIYAQQFASTPRIRLILQQILDTPPEKALRKLYLEGKALELLSVFCSEVIACKQPHKAISKAEHRALLWARKFIDQQFIHPLSIAQIAKACFLSETKLKQGFKICFGCTVYEYIVEKRMEMAYTLIRSEDYKIKDVVWMVGYSNASHFSALFRKRYGLNPGEI